MSENNEPRSLEIEGGTLVSCPKCGRNIARVNFQAPHGSVVLFCACEWATNVSSTQHGKLTLNCTPPRKKN